MKLKIRNHTLYLGYAQTHLLKLIQIAFKTQYMEFSYIVKKVM
jgi:hypothetical protein